MQNDDEKQLNDGYTTEQNKTQISGSPLNGYPVSVERRIYTTLEGFFS